MWAALLPVNKTVLEVICGHKTWGSRRSAVVRQRESWGSDSAFRAMVPAPLLMRIKFLFMRCTFVSRLPGRVDDVSSVEREADLLVVVVLTVVVVSRSAVTDDQTSINKGDYSRLIIIV